MKKVIYFNQWFSSIAEVIDDIKLRSNGELHIVGSSKNKEHSYKDSVDEFIVETWKEVDGDIEATKDNYINWVLELCKNCSVDLFFVKKHADWVAERAYQFEKIGVKLINEKYYVLETMRSKATVYNFVKITDELKGIVPRYIKSSDKNELYDLLESVSDDNPWCFKLDSDEGGASFRRIDTNKITLDSLKSFRVNAVSKREAKNMLAYTEASDLHKLLYMELLDAPEISVDCYNSKKGFIAICREKIAGTRTQKIYYNAEISSICEKLMGYFEFEFPFNVQFRVVHNGDSTKIEDLRLLEINSRMSGGTYYSTMFGMNLAYVCLCDNIDIGLDYNIEDFINFEDKYVTYVEKAIAVNK